MPSSLDERIHAVREQTLTPLVQHALGRTTGHITHWTVERVQMKTFGGGMGPSAIYRFSGAYQDGDFDVPWSLILKVVTTTLQDNEAGPAQRNDNYREVEFYRSELVHTFPAGLRAADCYAVVEQSGDDGQIESWLWLEALVPQPGSQWSLDDHYHLAYSLGILNGAFVVDRALPAATWLDVDGIRKYLDRAAPMVNQLFAHRELPLVQRAFPPTTIDAFFAFWNSREQHLQVLAALPQTLCHGDAQVSNLFLQHDRDGQLETVAIDWTHVGRGAVGCDPGQLLSFSLGTQKVNIAQAGVLDQAIFEGYLAGFRKAGWHGDPKLLRLGFTAATLKSRTTGVIRAIPFLIDDTMRQQAASRLTAQGLTLDAMLDSVAQTTLFFDKLFQESLALRDQLQ